MDHNPHFNDELKHGQVKVADLIENLRRFPQDALMKISRDMLSVRYRERIYWLNADVPSFQDGNAPMYAEPIQVNGDTAIERLYQHQLSWIKFCGGDLDGYIANYHKSPGWRSIEEVTAIYDADMEELKRIEQRLNVGR